MCIDRPAPGIRRCCAQNETLSSRWIELFSGPATRLLSRTPAVAMLRTRVLTRCTSPSLTREGNHLASSTLGIKLNALKLERKLFISSNQRQQMESECGMDTQELLTSLVEVAQQFSLSEVSQFKVGAAGLGSSGNIYLGANIEFPFQPINNTVHAEQFLVTNAFQHGEPRLLSIALSAAPCGHCRQFLNELVEGSRIRVNIPGVECVDPPLTLHELLPHSFGPGDLDCDARLLDGVRQHVLTPLDVGPNGGVSSEEREAVAAAVDAAERSYSPYTKSASGVALRLKDGTMVCGSYLETAAFNPSLPPIQAALIGMVVQGRQPKEIDSAVLVEIEHSAVQQAGQTKALLRQLAPHTKLAVHLCKHAQ